MTKNLTMYHVKVLLGEKSYELSIREDESILDALSDWDIFMNAVCAGRGTCGKCRIKVVKGSLKITEQDKKIFTDKELQEGFRLSCMAFPREDCTIWVEEETGFEIVSESRRQAGSYSVKNKDNSKEEYAVGIDIGTTTIAMELVGIVSGRTLSTYTDVNSQRAYGADVIARIHASNGGKGSRLRECIRRDLLAGIRTLTEASGVDRDRITKIAIAGNTTMGHLFMGYSCESLGVYPYRAVNSGWIQLDFQEAFGADDLKASVVLLPGISAFVGGDIVAGLLALGFDAADTTCMLIDLGTNGEMAIGSRQRILASSAAVGPAFEGGNISCGMAGISGAISHVTIRDGKAEFRTIGDKPPAGLCGTGVIEIVSELFEKDMIDSTGLYRKEYFENGFEITRDHKGKPIVFTQKDIREVQLAKAAVRAGIEILMRRFGTDYDGIDTVCLAGGFGYKTDLSKALRIGLLPEQFNGKIEAVGNSSLAGALRYLKEPDASDRLDRIISISKEINLSEDRDFYELYVKHMDFV